MALSTENELLYTNITSWNPATIENINWVILNKLFRNPPKKKKTKKGPSKHRIDKRLLIWKKPREHQTQKGLHSKSWMKRREKAKKELFFLYFWYIIKNIKKLQH